MSNSLLNGHCKYCVLSIGASKYRRNSGGLFHDVCLLLVASTTPQVLGIASIVRSPKLHIDYFHIVYFCIFAEDQFKNVEMSQWWAYV